MYQKLITIVFIILPGLFYAQIPAGYYDGASGTGDILRGQLEDIIDNHSSQSYTSLWTHFQTTDVDIYYENDGTVMDMYSENPSGVDPYNYIFVTDQCGNYGGEGDCYNREHSFPKSWFNDASPMYTDLYHLYPTDGYVNGIRSNYPFGETVSPTYTSSNGSKRGACSYPGYTGTIFEPIDEYKGDFARSYFYMATRYYSQFSGFSSPMLSGDNYTNWAKAMLLEWHDFDPVSQKEIDRNEDVYDIQGNRNPYIDHPEWACIVFGSDCPGHVEDPSDLIATAVSESQINLSWTLNADNDDVVLAFNTIDTFGDPSGTYTVGEIISGGGEVLYAGSLNSYEHTGLTNQTYYYKLWSVNGSVEYSEGITANANPLYPEPSNDVTNFIISNETSSSISLTWSDATGGQLPDAYLIKANTIEIIAPVDGIPESDDLLVKNISYGSETVTFSGLFPSTMYFFEIYPYTNSGSNINYKTDSPGSAVGNTTPGSSIIYTGSFETGNDGFTFYNTGGTPDWERTTDGGTYSPGDLGHDGTYYMWYYGWNGDADDWLISPEFDLSNFTDSKFEFWSWMRNSGTNLILKVSSDYPGTGDPSVYSWSDLSPVLASSEFTWTHSGELDLSAYDGQNIYLAYRYQGIDVDRNWAVDDITLSGILASSNDTDSEASVPGTQIPAGAISSLADTEPEAVDVFSFTIEDMGTTDGLITRVTRIRIFPGAANTADWTDHIQALKLYDGSQFIDIISQSINDTYIELICSPFDVSDGTFETITLSLYLNDTNIQDGTILSFKIDADNHGFLSDDQFSEFASVFNSGNDISSNEFILDVSGTELIFTQQPVDTEIDQIMNPGPELTILDINGNIDIDYDIQADLYSEGTLLNEPLTGAWESGILTFGDVIHTDDASDIILTVLSGSYEIDSEMFTIYCNPEDIMNLELICGDEESELSWINPDCINEMIIVVNDDMISGIPSGNYSANSTNFQDELNPDFPGGGKVVYNGLISPQTVTGLINGNSYYFKIFVNAYGEWSSGIESDCTPLNTNEAGTGTLSNFDVYPNPAGNMLTIDFDDFEEEYFIELINLTGISLLKLRSDSENLRIDIDQFPKGVYIIEITTNKDSIRKRIILQ